MVRSCANAIVDQSRTAPRVIIRFMPRPYTRCRMFQTPRRVEPRREPPTFAATRLVMILAALPCEERPLRAQVVFKSTQEDNQMKRIILTSACIMALATGGAFAQTQPAPGASGQA